MNNKSALSEVSERIESYGACHLSNRELLMLILGDEAAAGAIMALTSGKLTDLASKSIGEIKKAANITSTKAKKVVAAMEISRRRAKETAQELQMVKTSEQVARYMQAEIGDSTVEKFAVMFLNRGHRILATKVISTGGYTGTVADPRVILKMALEYNAVSIVLSHNHPSGNLRQSRADEELTMKIKEAARYFDIEILDHVIVSNCGYYSFADEGLI